MTNEELAMKIKAGNQEAVPALWEQVRRLCFLILRRFSVGHEENLAAHGVTMEDLEQEAFLAVLDAVEAYAPGLAFVSDLAYPIRNRAGALCGLRTRREKPLDRSRSLEKPIGGDDGEISLGDALEDNGTAADLEAVLEDTFRKELREALKMSLDTLPADWGQVLRAWYFDGFSLQEIGEQTGCSRENIRQKEQKGLRRMRSGHNLKLLFPFMDELR